MNERKMGVVEDAWFLQANESPLQKMPRIEGKSEEKGKEQTKKLGRRTEQCTRGDNTTKKPSPVSRRPKELFKEPGGRISMNLTHKHKIYPTCSSYGGKQRSNKQKSETGLTL